MEKENILFSAPNIPIKVKTHLTAMGKSFRGRHFHKAIEIVAVKKGKLKCEVENEDIILNENALVVIAPQAIHTLSYFEEESKFTYMQIDIEEHLRSFLPSKDSALFLFIIRIFTKPYLIFDKKSDFGCIYTMLEEEYQSQRPYYEVMLHSYSRLITSILCRENMFSNISEISKSKDIMSVMPAIEYIEKNYRSKLSLDMICSDLHMDKFNFCKAFKAGTGITFVEYLNLRRLNEAERLLIHNNYAISDVALESGFSSIQNFNRFFKKTKHISPLSYRKMYYEKKT